MRDAIRNPESDAGEPDNTGASYCCACDAPAGGCEHGGPRYLAPIVYAQAGVAPSGQPIWAVPPRERWRVEHPPSTWDRDASARIDYGPRARETFPPVTTALGEHVRQTGLRMLSERYRVLVKRATRRMLTPAERNELDTTERALAQLQAMAPSGELQAPKHAGPFGIVDQTRPD